jgi:hypothetical protein
MLPASAPVVHVLRRARLAARMSYGNLNSKSGPAWQWYLFDFVPVAENLKIKKVPLQYLSLKFSWP